MRREARQEQTQQSFTSDSWLFLSVVELFLLFLEFRKKGLYYQHVNVLNRPHN